MSTVPTKSLPAAATLVQTTFFVDPDTALPADEPSAPTTRLFWLALSLFRHGRVNLDGYHRTFSAGEKTLQRDLTKLRKLGERYGFRVSRLQHGEVRLLGATPKLQTQMQSGDLGAILQAVAHALGDPVAADLPIAEPPSSDDDVFLRIAVPRPIAGTRVGSIYRALRQFAGDAARVAFRYRRRDGTERQRIVDPHAAVFHSGRYYLVGYDVRARDWRLFALDGILGEIKRVGRFKRRAIPAAYTQLGAVGLIKTGPAIDVTIELSAEIASAVVARVWHDRQHVVARADGSSLITLPFYDVGEAVRWTMSFGTGARIVAPPQVVTAASKTAEQLARSYAPELRAQLRELGQLDLAPIGA